MRATHSYGVNLLVNQFYHLVVSFLFSATLQGKTSISEPVVKEHNIAPILTGRTSYINSFQPPTLKKISVRFISLTTLSIDAVTIRPADSVPQHEFLGCLLLLVLVR